MWVLGSMRVCTVYGSRSVWGQWVQWQVVLEIWGCRWYMEYKGMWLCGV